jgi:hypothetical protein
MTLTWQEDQAFETRGMHNFTMWPAQVLIFHVSNVYKIYSPSYYFYGAVHPRNPENHTPRLVYILVLFNIEKFTDE